MTEDIWKLERGEGPLIAAAIHDGHAVREEVLRHMTLTEQERLYEEDPFTSSWTQMAPTRIVALRSRFELDLNRPRDMAVYRSPEDAWGLRVWHSKPPEEVVTRSLRQYDDFYAAVEEVLSVFQQRYGYIVVFDLHSYNHRREGPDGPFADPSENPQVNVGTGTIPDRGFWAPVVDGFIGSLEDFDFPGGRLDVRENIRFRGGHFAGWIHERFPRSACVLSVEVKKFFMDEWTGMPDPALLASVGSALSSTVPGVLAELERMGEGPVQNGPSTT